MSNHEIKLYIKPEDIYNKLIPEQKEKYKSIKIISVELLPSGGVELQCIALTDNVIETSCRQMLFSDVYIDADIDANIDEN